MRAGLFILAFLVAIITSPVSQAYEFPLNQPVFSFLGGNKLSMHITCTVNKTPESALYEYIIALDYKTPEKKLLSWNFLDWILSNYQNAIERKSADSHLFPLKIEGGNYKFSFKSEEAPVWSGSTLVQIFHQEASAERVELNERSARDLGISVSSYDYLSYSMAFGASSCLPRNLLVFPRNLRSGF
ncbi:MAG: hypothetical protein Q8R36_01890 [bacterium]|nr:hypothetical protein [bacterium]